MPSIGFIYLEDNGIHPENKIYFVHEPEEQTQR